MRNRRQAVPVPGVDGCGAVLGRDALAGRAGAGGHGLVNAAGGRKRFVKDLSGVLVLVQSTAGHQGSER